MWYNSREEDRKGVFAMKKILLVPAAVLVCLAVCAVLTVTLSTDGFLPSFLPIGAYQVNTSEYGAMLPRGSLVVAERGAVLGIGDIVVLPVGSERVIGSVLELNDGTAFVRAGGTDLAVEVSRVCGRVYYRFDGLGDFCARLRQYRVAIWCVMLLIAAAAAAFVASAPARRHKAEVKRLVELFDYYGRKFDEEEKDVEY